MAKSKFILDKYKRSKNTEEESKYPYWLDETNLTLVKLYERVNEVSILIKESISNGEELSPKQRQIVKKDIAAFAGIDPSNFRPKRPAEPISNYINQVNDELKNFWATYHPVKRTGREKLLRSELEIQNRELKEQIKVMESVNYREYFDAWVNEWEKRDGKRLSGKVRDLEIKLKDAKDERDKLKLENKRLTRDRLKVIK